MSKCTVFFATLIFMKSASIFLYTVFLVLLLNADCIFCQVKSNHLGSFNNSDTVNAERRSTVTKCFSRSDCELVLPGSLCMNLTCACPHGYLRSSLKSVCFQPNNIHLGNVCNQSIHCGEESTCVNNVCQCPEGFQLLHVEQANLCILWHRPTRVVDRCRSDEDCLPLDPNSACGKRWCQCRRGFQLFETMLFGLKHRCFKTYKKPCNKSGQCTKLSETVDEHCICHFGYCHCIPNSNSSISDIYGRINEKGTWYEHWKKDVMLATRLLFITIVLFFVPCFVYATLGVRNQTRDYFPRVIRPTRNHVAQIQPSRRAADSHPPLPPPDFALIGNRPAPVEIVPSVDTSQAPQILENEVHQKAEEPPPSYDDIMRVQCVRETPPPPYREL